MPRFRIRHLASAGPDSLDRRTSLWDISQHADRTFPVNGLPIVINARQIALAARDRD